MKKFIPLCFLLIVGSLLLFFKVFTPEVSNAQVINFTSKLSCNFPVWAVPPATHKISSSIGNIKTEMRFSSIYGGIGTEWNLINNDKPNNPVNILEARSGAGAAFQYTEMMTFLDGNSVLANQASGNGVGYQWGYSANLVSTPNTISSTDYINYPNDSFKLPDGPTTGATFCKPFDNRIINKSYVNNSIVFNQGKFDLSLTPNSTCIGNKTSNVIDLSLTHKIKAVLGQNWKNYSPVQALYLNRSIARSANARMYLVDIYGKQYGPYSPFDLIPSIPLPGMIHQNDGVSDLWLFSFDLDKVVLVYNIQGRDIAVVKNNLYGKGGILGLEKQIYCSDPNKDSCGSFHFIFDEGIYDQANTQPSMKPIFFSRPGTFL